MSGSNRSDPYLGSDFATDDAGGWGGQNNSMNWRFIKVTTGLHAYPDFNTEHLVRLEEQPNGSWVSSAGLPRTKKGWEVKGWTRSPIEPVNVLYVPRKTYIIEASPFKVVLSPASLGEDLGR